MMTDLRICFLGPPEVLRSKDPVSQCLSQKAQGLLAYLAQGPVRGFTRERLAAMFWGETDDKHANFNLRRCLWSLRKAINPPGAPSDLYLRYEGGRYSFDRSANCWFDVAVFEHAINTNCRRRGSTNPSASPDANPVPNSGLVELRGAVELYRGDFLEGCRPSGCPDFMDWLFLERDRLKQQYVKAMHVLAVESVIQGSFQQAIADFQQILAAEPLNEEAHRGLMVIYYVLGQRDRAVEQYQTLCRVLHQLLDLRPLAETQAMYQDIRGGTLAVQGAGYWFNSIQETAVKAMPRGPFIGREPEQSKLKAALEAATRGQGGLVVLSGEGGVGKTRLVEEFLHHVSCSSLYILQTCCYAQEQGSSYQPIIDALRAFLPSADLNYIRRLDSLWLTEVARLVPELHSHLASNLASPALPADQERSRLYEGLAQLVSHLSQRRPLVIVLDDFHTADEPTFDLIHYLARRLESASVLIVLAVQREALPDRPTLTKLLHELERGTRLVTIPLSRLSEVEALELTRRTLGRAVDPETIVHRLYRETGGNPFFLVEMLKDWEEWQGVSSGEAWVPSSAKGVIERRLNRLDEADMRILTRAAVIGRQFNLATLQQIYGGDELELLIALDRLLSRGWIVELRGVNPGTYEFSHGLVRESIYQTLRADWLLYLHRRAGLVLENEAGAEGELAGVLAHHFHKAHLATKALHYSLQAARHAQKLYGNREAAAHYRRALEIAGETAATLSESESLEIQYQLGKAHEFLGEYDTAIAVYKAALPACDLTRSSHRRIWFQLATAYDRKGEYDQALDHLRAMETHLLEPKDQAARLEAAMVGRGMAMVYLHREQSHHALAYCRQVLALVQDPADKEGQASTAPEVVAEKVAIYEIMADSYFHLGDYHAAVDHFKQVLEIAHLYDWKPTISRLLLGLGKISRRRGAYDQAEGYAQQSLDICHDIGHIAGQAASVGALGDVAYNRGEFEQAISHYQQALATFRQIGDRHGIADYSLSVAFVRIDQGEIDEAEKHLLEALSIGESINAALVLIRGQYHLTRVARARGHLDEAQASAEQVIQAAQQAGIRLLEAMGYYLWGEILAQNRMPAQAEVCMLKGLRLLEGLGDPYETACALRSHARLLASRGDVSHAQAQLERAAAVFAELGAQRELAKTTAELARLCSSQK